MQQFFKFTLATIVGILLCLFFLMVVAALFLYFASQEEKTIVEPNTVLHLKLDYDIPDHTQPGNVGFGAESFGFKSILGINDILADLNKAAKDDNIKGILLDLSNLSTGMGLAEELRQKLTDFKASGKFIYAYGEVMTQKAYYIASVADSVFVNPRGVVLLKGFSTELTFFKESLDKLGIEPEVFYAGNFKSATEPIRYTKMSEYNRLQIRELLNGYQKNYLETIAEARRIPFAEITDIVDKLLIQTAEDAKKYRIVDDLLYIDQVRSRLCQRIGIDADKDLQLLSLKEYHSSAPSSDKTYKDKVAVLFAEGDIVDGKGDDSNIASEDYIKAIRKLRDDKNLKALVLRVNSGGGSSLASDLILRELDLLQQKGIPVVVSMGDVAASGGYYIAAHADTIVAQNNTVTGSIGVFGLTAELDNFYREKLGFTFDTVKTSRHSDFPLSPIINRDYTDEEKSIIQAGVNRIYEDFLKIVANGRNMTRDQVHEIAQGRVWRGQRAKEIGLVDVIGGLEDAVKLAAQKAGLPDGEYKTSNYPEQKSKWEQILGDFMTQTKQDWVKEELGEQYVYYKQLKGMLQLKGIQMRMPFELRLE